MTGKGGICLLSDKFPFFRSRKAKKLSMPQDAKRESRKLKLPNEIIYNGVTQKHL